MGTVKVQNSIIHRYVVYIGSVQHLMGIVDIWQPKTANIGVVIFVSEQNDINH